MLRNAGAASFAIALLANSNCGGGGGDTQTTPVTPTATVLFPLPMSSSENDAITMLGTATLDAADMPLLVNGAAAATTDRFTHWSATVPIRSGRNEFTLTTSAGAELANVVVDGIGDIPYPIAVAFDRTHGRVLVMGRKEILSVDPANGSRTVLSDATTPDTDNPFTFLMDEDVDSGGQLLVFDMFQSFDMEGPSPQLPAARVAVVDLDTGHRNNVPSAVTLPIAAGSADLAADGANDRALLVGIPGGVRGVDLASGAIATVSDNTTPDNVEPFVGPTTAIAVDAPRNRALVGSSQSTWAPARDRSSRTSAPRR
jgi:hypothetical protein